VHDSPSMIVSKRQLIIPALCFSSSVKCSFAFFKIYNPSLRICKSSKSSGHLAPHSSLTTKSLPSSKEFTFFAAWRHNVHSKRRRISSSTLRISYLELFHKYRYKSGNCHWDRSNQGLFACICTRRRHIRHFQRIFFYHRRYRSSCLERHKIS
jgi:hypothetical protein